MGDTSRLVILAPLRIEAKAIRRALRARRDVELHVIGLGGARIPRIESGARVIVTGIAGALDPALRVGDLVLDWEIRDLPSNLPWHVGPIHSTSHVVATAAEKAALFAQTGALAVDMEQAAVRRAVPVDASVLGLRAISDPADMALDPAVLKFIDETGRPRPLAILPAVLRRPGLLQHLLALRANSALALRNLSLAIGALVDRFPPGGPVAYAPPTPYENHSI